MSESSTFACVLVGSQSLIIKCAEYLQQNHHSILLIISDDPNVHDWSDKNNIKSLPLPEVDLDNLEQDEFDYLFSIANLTVLPRRLIEMPKVFAINFHDGPLPEYAGLNTPTWAIVNQQKQHAINWHIMTDEVDKGDVLVTLPVPMSDHETSLSLNTKCFDVGIEGFIQLVDQIADDGLNPQKQDLESFNYYQKCKRPAAASTILWSHSAEQISALVKALKFGPYWNPIGFAKLFLGNSIALVKKVEVLDRKSNREPGSILSLDNELIIATSTFDLKVTDTLSIAGRSIPPTDLVSQAGLNVGDTLPALTESQIESINQLDRVSCRYEKQWINELSRLKPLMLPYVEKSNNTGTVTPNKQLRFSTPHAFLDSRPAPDGDKLLQALLLYFSLLTRQENYSLAFNDVHKPKDRLAGLYFEQRLPFNVTINYQSNTTSLFKSLAQSLEEHRNRASYGIDLTLRDPGLAQDYLSHSSASLSITLLRSSHPTDVDSDLNGKLVIVIGDSAKECVWHYNDKAFSSDSIKRMQEQFTAVLNDMVSRPDTDAGKLSVISSGDLKKIDEWNKTDFTYDKSLCIHQLFEQQATKTPDAIALSFQGKDLSYKALNSNASQIAHVLIKKGIKPDELIGVLIDRSDDMLTAMLGVMKAGAAYLPVDPTYPEDRINFMLEDSGVSALITQNKHTKKITQPQNLILIDEDSNDIGQQPATNPDTGVTSENLAYIIYTSGSTGKPKGVMVRHCNVINFFVGMDQRIESSTPGVWLAVTSISFDISVLELFWTLSRGFHVVLYAESNHKPSSRKTTSYPDQDMQFSMFYWNVSDDKNIHNDEKYKLLIESVKYGDQNGFSAVWTPERHFHAFGGLYPNPSVTSAALATITENIHIRAGSCVVPLHHPVRVVEEWSMVDNFSNGRVGLAVAAGWQPNDFVLMPQNYTEAKQIMFDSTEQIKKLWRGETLEFPDSKGELIKVRTLPRPIQKDLPIWITTAGNPETFRMAGEIGANVLTHLLGQSVEDVHKNLQIYQDAYTAAGHSGKGEVTLLLHTLVGPDTAAVKNIARQPMKNYLTSAMFLVKAAAWHFPTFKELSEETGQTLDEYFNTISDDDLDALLEFAYERYFTKSGLFGTPENCLEMVDRLKEIGVTEIGCLIDYGIETDIVLEHLPYLNELRKLGGIIEHVETTNDDSIPDLIQRYGVTHFQCTPSMASMLTTQPDAQTALKSLDCMMVGGEALPPALAEQLSTLVGGKLVNMYGPTETTIWSTTQQIEIDKQVTIGTPIYNTYIYVLDEHMQPVPIGVPGELYIGGDGVTKGYLNRPELTSERFVQNPFKTGSDQFIYKTGDLVRYRPDSTIDYIGRTDFQVKLRGYRIELGEIEALLGQHPGIRDAVVIVREDIPGDQRLIAYVTTSQGNTVNTDQLRELLRENLPEYMIPSNISLLEKLPLTPNGKIDRKALPIPVQEQSGSNQIAQEPTTVVEMAVEKIWCEVLGLEKSGIHDNFFELGGHSLTATQLIARLRKSFHIELPLHMIFEAPSIAGLSQALLDNEDQPGQVNEAAAALEQKLDSVNKVYRQEHSFHSASAGQSVGITDSESIIGKYPATEWPALSFGQQRLWFLDKLEPGSHYNDSFALSLKGDLNVDAFENSINAVISRHDILRTRYATHDGEAYQLISPELHLKMENIDLRNIPHSDRSGKAQALITEQIAQPIDLAAGPILRTTLYQLDDNEYIFLLVVHQIANDSWSLGIFMDELWKLYQAYTQNKPSPLADLALQYSDYAQWQRDSFEESVINKELAYWQEKLSGELTTLDLLTDYPRPPEQSFEGARHFINLPDKTVKNLQKFSAKFGCTPFISLLTVFKVLLYRYTGQLDIIVGTPIANREHQETTPLIGMFINNLVLRTDLSGNPSFQQLLTKVIQTTTGAYDHPNVPFERLVETLHPERDLSRTPLFQIMFDYQNTPMELPKLLDLDIGLQQIDGKMARFDITLELTEVSGSIKGHIEYNTNLFSADRIERMANHFQNLLEAAIDAPHQHLSDLRLLSDAEQKQLLLDWNDTLAQYPADKGIHQLFEQQASLNPDSTALIIADEVLSYDQLNRQANRLANHLRDKGIKSNIPVGICMDRCSNMLVAMVGILKAGAAYLPLDPSYPDERITYMLEDSQSSFVITHRDLASRLSGYSGTTISLDQEISASEENPDNAINNNDLAYIIYTSGSTGKPKGVEVPHGSVVNFLSSMQHEPGIQRSDVLLAVTTISFDISILEIFLPLASGATVVMADRDTAVDGKQLLKLMNDRHVTILQATPATWRLLLAAGWEGSENMKALCGGEAMPRDIIEELVPRAGAGLWNMYGPTETTIWSSCYRLKGVDDSPLIGRPIANTHIYILDENKQPVPVGIPGEIYIGGDGVVRGYHNKAEMTLERFLDDPYSATPAARLYRTGDKAFYHKDGNIEYMQRIDNQVKVRGFRIELAEIEASLVTHDAVRQAVVTVHEERPGDKRLIAYVVYVPGKQATVSELRKYLKGQLPDYMVPAMYVDVHELPLTPSGKVDRKALPNPFQQGAVADNYVAPRNEPEKRIASIWKEVLHVDKIGIHDNFFDLGGHSLLSMQVIVQIEKETGCPVGPRAMVMDTLEQIAATCPEMAKQNHSIEQNLLNSAEKPKTVFARIVKLIFPHK